MLSGFQKTPNSSEFLKKYKILKTTGPGQFIKIYFYKKPQDPTGMSKIKYPPHTGTNTAAKTLIAEELETLMFGEVRWWEERESRERNVCVACVCAHWVLLVED